jgi:hypothetical protein
MQLELFGNKEKFNNLIDRFSYRNIIREDFFESVMELAEYKIDKTYVPAIPMIDYKRAIVGMVNDIVKERQVNYYFTDEELLENRIINDLSNKDMKITKLLTKKVKEVSNYMSTQFLDYFNKLPIENDEYYISGNPIDILESYIEVDTCVSPGGDNIANIFQFLVSPMVHVAFTKDKSSRMLVFVDQEKKIAATNRVYGKYNLMLEFSVLKWLGRNGYSVAEKFNDYFSSDGLYYSESRGSDMRLLLEHFDIPMESPVNFSERVDMFVRPKGLKTVGDLITGSSYSYASDDVVEHLTTTSDLRSASGMLLFSDEEFCRECGDVISNDYYNYDFEMCSYCYEDAEINYCEECGNDYSYDNFDLDENMCNHCLWERNREEETDVDNEVDRMREDAVINQMEEANGKE